MRPVPARPSPARAAASGVPALDRAGGAILVALGLVLAARALLAGAPGMWAWSLNLQRFIDPLAGWATWAIAAVALVPAVARRLAAWMVRAGDAIATRPLAAGLAAGAITATLVLLFPDRVRFVGDFLLRQGSVETREPPTVLFPQALPLDILLHYHVPRYLTDSALFDPNSAARVVGAIEAALLGALAVAFARTLALRGAPAAGCAALVVVGGYLGMFTGFSKAFAELCLLVAATAVYGLRVLREGRGLLPLGLVIAVGATLHRSALGLLPAVALAWSVWAVRHAGRGAWRRPASLLGLAIPAVTLAVMIPRIAAIVARWDTVHFAPPGSEARGGPLAVLLTGARPADLGNLLVMLSPAILVAPVLAWVGRRQPLKRNELLFLLALALPFLLVMPFIHPVQGLFRDWDDFAATGVAVSLLVAWLAARALAAPGAAATVVALVLAAGMPTLQWLIHHADYSRGLQRVRAFMVEPPQRPPSERASTWDYLGVQAMNHERWDEAAEAFARASETSPSPRILQERAMAETMRQNFKLAQQLYREVLAKAPENPFGWLGLGTTSLNLGDYAEARRGAEGLLALQPGNADALRLLREIELRQRPASQATP